MGLLLRGTFANTGRCSAEKDRYLWYRCGVQVLPVEISREVVGQSEWSMTDNKIMKLMSVRVETDLQICMNSMGNG